MSPAGSDRPCDHEGVGEGAGEGHRDGEREGVITSQPDASDGPAAPEAAAAPADPTARPSRRGRETVRDMVWSLAVVGILVAFILAVTYRDKPDAVQVVDPAPAAEAAKAQAPFVPAVPTGLPTAWRATSARYEPASRSTVPNASVWHVGYVTPSTEFAGIDQADGEAAVLIKTVLPGGARAEDSDQQAEGIFAGWQRWVVDGENRTAYVLTLDDSTVIVHGTASDAELAVLAQSLEPLKTA